MPINTVCGSMIREEQGTIAASRAGGPRGKMRQCVPPSFAILPDASLVTGCVMLVGYPARYGGRRIYALVSLSGLAESKRKS